MYVSKKTVPPSMGDHKTIKVSLTIRLNRFSRSPMSSRNIWHIDAHSTDIQSKGYDMWSQYYENAKFVVNRPWNRFLSFFVLIIPDVIGSALSKEQILLYWLAKGLQRTLEWKKFPLVIAHFEYKICSRKLHIHMLSTYLLLVPGMYEFI